MFKAVEDMESFGTDQLAASLTEHYGLAPVQAGQEAARTLELLDSGGLDLPMLTRRHFYYLLRVALQCPPEGCTAPEFGTLTAEDWRQLLELSRSQTVTGLVYAAISSLPEAGSMPEQVSTRFMMEAEACSPCRKAAPLPPQKP